MIVIKSFLLIVAQIIKEYTLSSIFIAMIILIIRYKMGRKNNVGCFLIYMYLVFIVGVTILNRIGKEKIVTHDFWGMRQLFNDFWYIVSFIENIVMFIPFGILYVLAFGNMQPKKMFQMGFGNKVVN